MTRVAAALALAWLVFPNEALAASSPGVEEARPPEAIGPPPPTGRKLYGWGWFGVGFGLANIVTGVVLIPTDPGDGGGLGVAPLAVGAGFVVLGSLGVHYGKRRRERYARWTRGEYTVPAPLPAEVEARRPPRGIGLTITGACALVTGVALLGYGLDTHTMSGFEDYALPWIIAGGATFASAVPVVVVGSVRVHRHIAWERSQRGLSLMPVPWWNQHGGGLALAGRF